MPEFWYSALDEAGVVQEGHMSAANENALADQLRAAGAFLIKTEVRDGSGVSASGRPTTGTPGPPRRGPRP